MGKRIVINDRTRKVRAGLLLLLILIGIGYAVIRSGLNINGTTHVKSNTWDVHFENYQASSGSVTPTTEPSTTGNPTTVTYEVTLTNPGDYYGFTIDAVNSGTMDTMIESVSSKLNDVEITPSTLPPYLSYSVTYNNGVDIVNKQQLLHNTREKIKIKVAYRDDIPTTDLPSTVQDLSLSFTITYVQKDNTAIPVDHSTTKYTSGDMDDYILIGEKIPNSIPAYDTPEEAIAAFDNRLIYLMHKIDERGYVLENHAGFVITDAMAQANPGMTAGTYYIHGGLNEDDDESGTAHDVNVATYNENKATLLSAFSSAYCTEANDEFTCSVTNLTAIASLEGNSSVHVGDGGRCHSDCDSAAYCRDS